MKLFEKVIIIVAVVAGGIGIGLVITFTLPPSTPGTEQALPPLTPPREAEALVTYVSGSVFLHRGDAWKAVAIGELVTAGDVLKTFENSFCDLQFGERAVFSILENTALKLETVLSSTREMKQQSRLLFGTLLCKVAKLAGDDAVSVRAGSRGFGVRGTEFLLARGAAGTVCAVRDGRVAIVADEGGAERLVAAGQEAAVDDRSGAVGPASSLSRANRTLLERLTGLGYLPLAGDAAARLVKLGIEVEPAAAEIHVDGKLAGYGSYAGLFPAGTALDIVLRKPGYREQSFTLVAKSGGNRSYNFRLELDAPEKGAALPGASEELERRVTRLEAELRKASEEAQTLSGERDELKKQLETGKKENARLIEEVEKRDRKIKAIQDELNR